jgi:hypothetical protein
VAVVEEDEEGVGAEGRVEVDPVEEEEEEEGAALVVLCSSSLFWPGNISSSSSTSSSGFIFISCVSSKSNLTASELRRGCLGVSC